MASTRFFAITNKGMVSVDYYCYFYNAEYYRIWVESWDGRRERIQSNIAEYWEARKMDMFTWSLVTTADWCQTAISSDPN